VRRWDARRERATSESCAAAENGQHEAEEVDRQSVVRNVLFVGNSHTYQPKELGGLPKVVERVAAAVGVASVQCTAVVQGGADLLDLWEEFEEHLRCSSSGASLDTLVLQVGVGADEGSRLATAEALRHSYAPLLLQLHPGCQVLIYQTWAGPRPDPDAAVQMAETADFYCSVLADAGISDARVARAGHAFLALQASCANSTNKRMYAALFKDDSGHGSALAGLLVAAVVVLTLGIGGCTDGTSTGSGARRLASILEAILPSAWRTASPGFADDDAQFGQKGWLEGNKAAPAALLELLQDPDDNGPLSRYPPGMRTERHTLGPAPGEVLVAAAFSALHATSPLPASRAGANVSGSSQVDPAKCGEAPSTSTAAVDVTPQTASHRRWRAH